MMKWAFLAATLAVAGIQSEASARPISPVQLVDGWYHQYLGRCADECGLRSWVGHLRCKSPDEVLSHILASDEYYRRNGCCAAGFIKGLYKDHLGRCAQPCEVDQWLCELRKCGCRQKLALKFLCAAKRELSGW